MNLRSTLSKYQNYFLGAAIILSSLAVSIRSSDGEVRLIFQNYPLLIFLFILLSSFLVLLYFQISKGKITRLTQEIRDQSKEKGADLNSLTDRQKEVYDLIIAGKSNKEIMSDLFIELSTLKSHINQIYKKLDVKNRSELKSI